MNIVKVEDNKDLVRDLSTGAILSNDKVLLNRHRARKAVIDKKQQQIEDLNKRLENLEKLVLEMTK